MWLCGIRDYVIMSLYCLIIWCMLPFSVYSWMSSSHSLVTCSLPPDLAAFQILHDTVSHCLPLILLELIQQSTSEESERYTLPVRITTSWIEKPCMGTGGKRSGWFTAMHRSTHRSATGWPHVKASKLLTIPYTEIVPNATFCPPESRVKVHKDAAADRLTHPIQNTTWMAHPIYASTNSSCPFTHC